MYTIIITCCLYVLFISFTICNNNTQRTYKEIELEDYVSINISNINNKASKKN